MVFFGVLEVRGIDNFHKGVAMHVLIMSFITEAPEEIPTWGVMGNPGKISEIRMDTGAYMSSAPLATTNIGANSTLGDLK